ncbi:NAD(P)/FAD-dependent oxidoreductase [Nitratireductor sp. XY-223]|uniref:NAD(P)/FAD-dependent oxidoreductase n=1 Tax=Nitratireductor sp. XY-223 TaxID=2561926 RepID=UPI0010A9BF4C|nr:NAD(P)/FAD-dependent oxidoreductase [Nitratireductor sp. XY-223]
MDHVDCIVAGAGVLGLAVARALALRGRDVIIVEAEGMIGTQTSSRNSEVIHAGIYYAAGSLKARFCVEGKKALYAYCAERGIPHERTGKLIVATDDSQRATLQSIHEHAVENGVDIRAISAEEAIEYEPELHCVSALHSPSTGIIDSHALMLSLQGEAEDAGAMIAFNSKVIAVRPQRQGFVLDVQGDGTYTLSCKTFVNAAGHGAWEIARSIEGLGSSLIPPHYLSKGNYYALSGHKSPFRQLIYPVPGDGSLGIHFTRDLAGQARFGPDVHWMEGETLDYTVVTGQEQAFTDAIRTYWPGLPENALMPSYCGIRPKMVPSGHAPADFMIQSPDENGISGLVQLFGMESPALTSCLVIGDHVAGLAADE